MLQLPLSFIASIFGMNNKQISGDDMPMTLQTQLGYICMPKLMITFLLSSRVRYEQVELT